MTSVIYFIFSVDTFNSRSTILKFNVSFQQAETGGVVVTSARPATELSIFAPDDSLTKDIPIPAKNLVAEEEVSFASVLKTQDANAEIETKLLNLEAEIPTVMTREERLSKSFNMCTLSSLKC